MFASLRSQIKAPNIQVRGRPANLDELHVLAIFPLWVRVSVWHTVSRCIKPVSLGERLHPCTTHLSSPAPNVSSLPNPSDHSGLWYTISPGSRFLASSLPDGSCCALCATDTHVCMLDNQLAHSNTQVFSKTLIRIWSLGKFSHSGNLEWHG